MKYLLFILSVLLCTSSFSQDEYDESERPVRQNKTKGLQTGLLLGSLFANKYTAHLYDGYGYNNDGVKNDFLNSFMYQKIVVEYGGGNGQPDRIAQELNVNPGEWAFGPLDMPVNMKYNPAFMVGLQARWLAGKKLSILLNANAAKLTVNGNFTIELLAQPIGPVQPGYQNIQIFPIYGSEQRIVIQLGMQRILGEDEVFNFIIEGGPLFNMVKFTSNRIVINSLQIDLMTYYNQYGNEIYRAKNLTGVSFGAFAGMGVDVNTNARWKLQGIYNPSIERIELGQNPSPRIQHTIGVRIYYDM